MYVPRTPYAIAFFVTTAVMAVLVMSLQGYIFARYIKEVLRLGSDSSVSSRAISTYFALFMFAEIFGVVVAWDSLRLRNTIQVIGLCLYHLALMVYAIIQIDQIKNALGPSLWVQSDIWGTTSTSSLEPWLIATASIIGACILLLAFFAHKLYREFGWTIYKHVGADLGMRRRYMAYQIFVALLKFDFIFFVGFTIQFTVIILNIRDPEFGLTLAVIPVTILGLLFTSWALRNEKLWGMFVTLAYFVCAMAYFLFKLIRMYTGPKQSIYGPARKPLATFASLTVALLLISLVNAVVCMRNFNKGLAQYVQRDGLDPADDTPKLLLEHWHSPDNEVQKQSSHRLELD